MHAISTIRKRSSNEVRLALSLWGGLAAGMNSTSSRANRSWAASRNLQMGIVNRIEGAPKEADAPAVSHQEWSAAFRLEICSLAAWLASSSQRLLSSCEACPLVHSHFTL